MEGFSPRTPRTDKDGFAETTFTPTSAGRIRVVATVSGVDDTATFYIGVQAVESAKVPVGTSIVPKVLVDAANRPAMLWVDNGAIYALVQADVERFAPSVDNALNIAIGGGKVYWTEKTGESSGTINSADLDGSDVTELKVIKSVPIGIAADTENSKLYWTNSRGRIQRANFDGSHIQNVMSDLPGLIDIAVARGIVFWTQYDTTANTGNVGIVNPNPKVQQRIARYIPTGVDMPGGLVTGGGKVYWTEMTGESSGTINSANLNGFRCYGAEGDSERTDGDHR